MNSYKQTMHVEDGQSVDQHIACAPAPVGFEGLGIAEQIAMRQHGTFAAPRCTTGVQNSSHVVCSVLHYCVFV